ncbi:PD-(D/E)XK nuclease family protein [Paragemmobacter straminiformis]|uniref:PD-(D/E)XK nuclease family protein n=1 Tax=Paragemmobacter straminiformis TaxID=2045119 RepID=A0A842I2R2_9RHOB|nr:PD-(D/E)XK nuclease family protein [Gemmobacter straminiformis]MBC2834066.1 PD-(D/E)XK nuclease family protein [Gemmobacter straminiformis]
MRLQPLIYVDPQSGACFPVTPSLLAEVYLVPKSAGWDASTALDDPAHPWAQSFGVDPEGVARAVERALVDVIHACPHAGPQDIDLAALPEGRARLHLSALLSVWQRRGTVPDDLCALRHVLSAPADQALVPLRLLPFDPDPHATATEDAVEARLLAHHGPASDEAFAAWQARQPRGAEDGALSALQRGLAVAEPASLDPSLAFYDLRDSLHEARFAAALARRMLDEGRVARQSDIAVLAIADPVARAHLAEAFDAQGLRLTGQEGPARRDVAGELASLALRVLQSPAPAMALASLAMLPLMPWGAANGAAIARDLMRGRYRSRIAARLTGAGAELWETLTGGASTAAQLGFKLNHLAERLIAPAGAEGMRDEARALLRRIAAEAGSGNIDWPYLQRIARAGGRIAGETLRHLDGVSLVDEGELPWRGCRHLIVTGFSAGHYPRAAGPSSLFMDSELRAIRRYLGLSLPGAALAMARGMALFQRQIGAASEGITFLTPRLDGMGKALAAPMTRALIARRFGRKEAELAQDPSRLPFPQAPVTLSAIAPAAKTRPDLPEDGMIELSRDLLGLRKAEDGVPLPQSPSRLETLMVSPLAWLLGEMGAEDCPWQPETLDILLKGTLAHHVLEMVFPAKAPLPDADALEALVGQHFAEGVRQTAPFLAAPEWKMERDTLCRDCLRAARVWLSILTEEGAEIVANEVTLAGEAHGIHISGRADSLLRLPDGQTVIVDHKKSSARSRRDRMKAGWDLQVALYRDMLRRPTAGASPETMGLDRDHVAIAYHTLNDGTVLRSGARGRNGGSSRVEDLSQAIAAQSLPLLQQRIAEAGAGRLRLNGDKDEGFLTKKAHLTPYAFDASPLVRAWTIAGQTIGPGDDDEGEAA